jgi:hypothetical protein
MRVQLSSPYVVGDETVYLIHPKSITTTWTKDTLIFRSSVWNSEGELISASFKKFFNWGEKSELYYTPFNLTSKGGVHIIEKLDGSTLIVSKYKGNYIYRTRGTLYAKTQQANGSEIEVLEKIIADANIFPADTWDYSLIFEWVSPKNQIVIRYDEPQFYLIGQIFHNNYSYTPQNTLDCVAKSILKVPRPKVFDFSSIKEMMDAVEAFKGTEGVCVYANEDQDIIKLKSLWYLTLHRLKSELSSFEKLVDLWIELNYPSYQEFETYITTNFDYELFKMVQGNLSALFDAKKEVDKIVAHMKAFAAKMQGQLRKFAAIDIKNAYGNTNRASYVFKFLDGKELDSKDIKKLIIQCAKRCN